MSGTAGTARHAPGVKYGQLAKEGFSRAAIGEAKYHIKKPRTEVREGKKRGAEFPGHNQVNAAMRRNQAMLRPYHTSGCLPCPYGTGNHPQTRWRRKGTGAPPPARRRVQTSEPSPHRPGTPLAPPAPSGNNCGAQTSEIVNLPAGYTHSHITLPSAKCKSVRKPH
jgi:hypothetical protein